MNFSTGLDINPGVIYKEQPFVVLNLVYATSLDIEIREHFITFEVVDGIT
jgi:hypothetical protein